MFEERKGAKKKKKRKNVRTNVNTTLKMIVKASLMKIGFLVMTTQLFRRFELSRTEEARKGLDIRIFEFVLLG